MKVRIVRIEKDLPLPEYKTEGAVAFDLYTRETKTIEPGGTAMLPTNFIIEVPQGHALVLAARSSLGAKIGLQMGNGIGIIDQDYHGPQDEIRLFVRNFTAAPVTVERGERLGQAMILPIARPEWEEMEQIKEGSRDGFGSTGRF